MSARDFHILFALEAGEAHGYGLVKQIADRTEGAIELDPANLYRALQRMLDRKLVRDAGRRPSPEAARSRRYYELTDLGRRVLAAEAERMRSLARDAEARELIPRRRGGG